MNDGVTVSDVCRVCDLVRSTFYTIMKKNLEAIGEIQEIISAKNREQLGLIILSKTEVFRKVIEAGLEDTTKPKDRQVIFMKLDERVTTMTKGMGIESEIESQAAEFLRHGPHMVQEKSRFSVTERIVTIQSDVWLSQIRTEFCENALF
jgi:hypothetical protein